jgi:tRNA pseudouridine synthase 10
MHILKKVIEIYNQHYLCPFCLGRMFSLLGTKTTNEDRGKSLLLTHLMASHKNYLSGNEKMREKAIQNIKILAERAHYRPAQEVLEKEGYECESNEENIRCYLCNNIFELLESYINPILEKIKGIEFHTFLIGTTPDAKIVNKEDRFKAQLNLLEAESFKSHFNRELGKLLSDTLEKPPEFNYPDLTIICSLGYDSFSVRLLIRSIFIYGRYKKLIRGVPQTRWPCRKCNGSGCEYCDFTGKMYETSVEELITPEFFDAAQAEDSKFHGAGREDIDVRMLGSGRPFVLELINPKVRSLDLAKLKQRVNSQNKGKVEIDQLSFSDKNEVIRIKQEAKDTKKTYRAKVETDEALDEKQFIEKVRVLKESVEGNIINQKTPQRVVHRRADKVRKKKIYKIEGSFIAPTTFEFTIQTQGGTYIKELITSDNGRTTPSFSELFDSALKCKALDVINIDY